MEIAIQKELKDMVKLRKYLPNDQLEAYLEYSQLYSFSCWICFLSERLRRMENEIIIQ